MTSALVVTNDDDRPSAEDADHGSERGLLDEQGEHVLPGAISDGEKLDQNDGQQHRERIVAAGFNLERRADPRPQAQPARVDQKEHRCGIGRRHDRADQQRLGPAHPEQIFRDRRGQRRR
jgi:hypothetical protein